MKIHVKDNVGLSDSERVVIRDLQKGTPIEVSKLLKDGSEVYGHVAEVGGHGVLLLIPYISFRNLNLVEHKE